MVFVYLFKMVICCVSGSVFIFDGLFTALQWLCWFTVRWFVVCFYCGLAVVCFMLCMVLFYCFVSGFIKSVLLRFCFYFAVRRLL
jgi:hypothetical protein